MKPSLVECGQVIRAVTDHHSEVPYLSKQFNIIQCLTVVLIVALGLGLLVSHVQHKREVAALQVAMEESRAMFRTIEYGAANLQLLGLNPAVWWTVNARDS